MRRGAAQAPLSWGAEASGLERDARAGISPRREAAGAGFQFRKDHREMSGRRREIPVAKPQNGGAIGFIKIEARGGRDYSAHAA
jgi:hypothetical protein